MYTPILNGRKYGGKGYTISRYSVVLEKEEENISQT